MKIYQIQYIKMILVKKGHHKIVKIPKIECYDV